MSGMVLVMVRRTVAEAWILIVTGKSALNPSTALSVAVSLRMPDVILGPSRRTVLLNVAEPALVWVSALQVSPVTGPIGVEQFAHVAVPPIESRRKSSPVPLIDSVSVITAAS